MHIIIKAALNAVVTCKIKWFQKYSSLRRRPSEIIFISARGNLPEIVSEAYSSSGIFSNMFFVAEIILK